jgi:phosphate-selective porin OprO/OprP
LRSIARLLGFFLSAALVAQESAEPPKRPWNELDTSWMTVRLGFAALEDGAFFSQDAESKQQVGNLPSKALFRVDDLLLSGQLKFARPWSFVVGGNYKGLDPTSDRGWTTTYVYLAIPLPAFLGTVTVGKQKEGVGLEMTENGRDLPFMERSTMSTAFAFVDSHVVGIRFSDTVAADRMTWSAGWFNNWLDDGLSFDESGQIGAARVTGLPIEAEGGRRLLHLGVSAVYRQSSGSFQLKSVPEVYEAPDFVDTGSFPADSGTSIGGELAAVEGPVTVTGEFALTDVSSPENGDPSFTGFYVSAAWTLTGETRPYDHVNGNFGMISPSAPFSFKHGGLGAWAVAARYSNIDLTSGAIDGGEFDRWSGALSWYPTSQWRFEFNYGYGRLRRAGLDGRTHFYQLRLQFQL